MVAPQNSVVTEFVKNNDLSHFEKGSKTVEMALKKGVFQPKTGDSTAQVSHFS
jgi:hypothetical protein